MYNFFNRFFKTPNWHNLRSTQPISRQFALDRGTPIDRIYIEHFLHANKDNINGHVCEISESTYSKKFGKDISKIEILHINNNNTNATIIGDLTNFDTLQSSFLDCFIVTQTLNFIYDFKAAITGIHYMLKTNGVALVTVSGICQISRYDMDRWGDYWRFTNLSIKKLFEDTFGYGNVTVDVYGNVLASVAFLEGISAEELTKEELFYKDKDYQIIITVKAIKR